MTARPVVTMDERDETVWLVDPERPDYPRHLGWLEGEKFCTGGRIVQRYTFAEIRAIADFLEQLEGANLLSGIREAGE